MLISMHYMRDGRTRLRSLLQNMEREHSRAERTGIETIEKTINEFKSNVYGVTLEVMNASTEIMLAINPSSRSESAVYCASQVQRAIKKLHRELKEADLLLLISNVRDTLSCFGDEEVFILEQITDYRNTFRNKFGKSERDLDNYTYQSMMNAVQPTGRQITILDAAGRNASNFFSLTESERLEEPSSYMSYALNVKEDSHLSYKTANFSRIALGSLRGGTYSNEVFDVMLLSPMIEWTKDTSLLLEKNEKTLLRETFKLLRPGGILFFTLPAFRFYKDICLLLAKGYKNIQVRKTTNMDDSAQMIYIMAERKSKEASKEIDETSYNMLRTLSIKRDIPTVYDESFAPVTLPAEALEVKFFRGAILNKDELTEILACSSCMEHFYRAQSYTYAHEETREPLLPFTTGQLGLVLTSGNLDGIIDEGNGHYHVVKGRVVKSKQTDESQDRENNEVTCTETIANRVEINVLTAEGDLKRLA